MKRGEAYATTVIVTVFSSDQRPQLDGTVPSTRVAVIEVSVGLIDAGTDSVTGGVDVPISVLPL